MSPVDKQIVTNSPNPSKWYYKLPFWAVQTSVRHLGWNISCLRSWPTFTHPNLMLLNNVNVTLNHSIFLSVYWKVVILTASNIIRKAGKVVNLTASDIIRKAAITYSLCLIRPSLNCLNSLLKRYTSSSVPTDAVLFEGLKKVLSCDQQTAKRSHYKKC